MRAVIAAGVTMLLLVGCASHSDDIKSVQMSPDQYASYDCAQIGTEMKRVSDWEAYLKNEVDANAKHDALLMGFSIALFPPALVFLEGDGEAAEKYASVRGEREALQAAGSQKNCQLAQQ